MTHLPTLGKLLDLPALQNISNSVEGFQRRDEIKGVIARRLKEHSTEHWLEILNAADIWCAEVLDWPKLCASKAFEELAMVQTLTDGQGIEILTTRLPIRLDGSLLTSAGLAPRVGEHTAAIQSEFGV
jgi:crotonobetainyl-CoA:carnitine CoA-transferase CaiB-like acyl-CoA transferase